MEDVYEMMERNLSRESDPYDDMSICCDVCGCEFDPEECLLCNDGMMACACGDCDNKACEAYGY
jgi:hypothetical protein